MGERDLDCLLMQAQNLQRVARQLQEQADYLESEVRLTISTLIEERNILRWRVDPYSIDAGSLADIDL
jgi:hypothetical protein